MAMAVYTPVSAAELSDFLAAYDIGALKSHEGIEAGVSNTNYFITTERNRYVLTLFEPHRVDAVDIPGFVDYAVVLEHAGVPCPKTMQRKDGAVLSTLNNRPAAIFSVLEGEGGHGAMLTPPLCEKAGALLAKMHLAAGDKVKGVHPNKFGITRCMEWLEKIDTKLDDLAPGLYDSTAKEFEHIRTQWRGDIAEGTIHGDLFPDNVFFKDGNITGVIDFHFVCRDFYAYDLAIAINAWCFNAQNEFQKDRMDAMMRGYNSVRPLSQAEREALPLLLRRAALRFLLSRAEEKLAWTPDKKMKPHDPLVFGERLRHFQRAA